MEITTGIDRHTVLLCPPDPDTGIMMAHCGLQPGSAPKFDSYMQRDEVTALNCSVRPRTNLRNYAICRGFEKLKGMRG